MSILLIGFDSAWTLAASGAIVGVLRHEDGTFDELGPPMIANFAQAEAIIRQWQSDWMPTATIVLLDQPTIVTNARGQRPVENIAASPVSRRCGGMQPANTGRMGMFDVAAPVWTFLNQFGGAADPLMPVVGTRIIETYPVLIMIALNWMLPHQRPTGRLAKYNPERRNTFSLSDWRYVCKKIAAELRQRRLNELSNWSNAAAENRSPRKCDQDGLDACLCLIAALYLAERSECLMVGELRSGYIVVPNGNILRAELNTRCCNTNRNPPNWVRVFTLRR